MTPRKSHSPLISDEILARRYQENEQAHQEHQLAAAARRDHDKRVAAGNLVQDLGGEFELALMNGETMRPDLIPRWVKAIAAYKAVLAEGGRLERLSQPMPGVTEYRSDVWHAAVPIFLAADTEHDRAVATLADLAANVPIFAVSVARCLRREIRAVAEGYQIDAVEPWKIETAGTGQTRGGGRKSFREKKPQQASVYRQILKAYQECEQNYQQIIQCLNTKPEFTSLLKEAAIKRKGRLVTKLDKPLIKRALDWQRVNTSEGGKGRKRN